MTRLVEVGKVANEHASKADPFTIRKGESRILVSNDYSEGLERIEDSTHLQILFGFHLSEPDGKLRGPVYSGERKGVFASRSPKRPSGLGLTTVELLHVEGNCLTVTGLDALNGSPVYDIKPYAPIFDDPEAAKAVAKEYSLANPRQDMVRLIRAGLAKECLTRAGELHGHYCPGLALGVYAAVECAQKLRELQSDGMENLMALVEINSCFVDGVQFVTGCTLGNNALVYMDHGKTAVTLVTRPSGKGVRICVKPGFRERLAQQSPEFHRLFRTVVEQRSGTEAERAAFKTRAREAAFEVVGYPFEAVFEMKEVIVELPSYAPIVESVVCGDCGEQLMVTKAVRRGSEALCRSCAEVSAPRVTGAGIVC